MDHLRRRLLGALALAPWTYLVAAPARSADVLVLGAGMAGLTCARELRQVGYSVIVLEARERIGGRTWTDATLGVPLDLGGAWIHGVKGNPLTRQVAEAGIETFATDWESFRLYAGKRALSESEQEAAAELYEELIEMVERQKQRAKPGANLADALSAAADELLDDDMSAAAVRWQIWSDIASEYGEDPERLSLRGWNEDEAMPGKHVLLKTGYGALLAKHARQLDVRRGTVVRSVAHGDEGVSVETSQGVYKGAAAVCTLPLGVLKAGSVRFDPVLPARQAAAVGRLGMGALDKIALRFPTSFWPDVHRFARVDGRSDQRCEFYNLEPMHDVPILVALVAGTRARALEALPEAAAAEQMLIELRAIFGQRVATPERVVRTRWASDPFARGSYSLIPPGAALADFDTLAKTPGARLFMAGEATVSDYPGTVHGALMSGLRAAGEVADVLG